MRESKDMRRMLIETKNSGLPTIDSSLSSSEVES